MSEPSRAHDVEIMNQPKSSSMPNDDLVILVTAFLGTPSTEQSALQDRNSRFDATLSGLRTLQAEHHGLRLLVAFTGDSDEAQRMFTAAGLAQADAQWFEQDSTLFVRGKGRLEHALITRSIQHWALQASNPWILKLTAKYTVENLLGTIDFIRGRSTGVCAWRHMRGRMVDTRVFAFRAQAYLQAHYLLDRIDDRQHYFMEHAVYDWVSRSSGTCALLVHRPLVSGLSGSTGVLSAPSLLKRRLVQAASMLWRFKPIHLHSAGSSKPMFIFVLGALKISGGVLEAFRLGQELRDAGEDVLIVVMWRSPSEIENADQLPIIRLTNWRTRIVLAVFQLPIIIGQFWWRTRSLERMGKSPIWIFTHYSTLPLALLIEPRRRWIFLQGTEWNFVRYPAVARLFKAFVLFFYRRARLLVASHFLANALESVGLRATGFALVWADPAYYRPVDAPRDIDVVVMLRKGQPKRLDLNLACLAQLSQVAPNLRIAAITPDTDLADLAAPLTSLCLTRPSQKEMADLYSRTKIFLLLSETEGFGLPPLEAMGAGCVPVCRDAGGPQSYMLGSLGDLLLPLTMPMPEICSKLIALLADPVALERYSDAARCVFQKGRTIAVQRAATVRSLMLEKCD